jgi:hypothetical protein
LWRGCDWAPFFCAHGADEFYVGDILEAVIGDLRFGDKFDGVGTLYPSAYTLCKVSEFIGRGSVPGVFELGVTEELSVFKGLSGFQINNGVCTVMASGKEASGNAVIGWVTRCASVLGNSGGNAVDGHSGGNGGVIGNTVLEVRD